MSKALRSVWGWIVNTFEYGDLIPLMVIVSAGHYIAVLQSHDTPLTAVAVGILVDLGHYRAVRIASVYRYTRATDDTKGTGRALEFTLRWSVVILLTVITFAYHLRFYANDWALAAPMPILIAFLAYAGNRGPQSKRNTSEEVEQVRAKLEQVRADYKQIKEKHAQEMVRNAQLVRELEQARSAPMQLSDGGYPEFAQICGDHNGNLHGMKEAELNLIAVLGGMTPQSGSTIKSWRDKYVKEGGGVNHG
jgi:hypothetical protein